MVIDLFYFNGELDVLEIRLNILNDKVDRFIIVEYPQTFSGKPKELLYKKNKERFKQWHDKITYYEGDTNYTDEEVLQAKNSPNTGSGEHYWVEEFLQKEGAKYALQGLDDDDIVFISDVDEIWNIPEGYYPNDDAIYKPKQLPYLYYLNNRTDEDWLGWTGTIMTKYKNIKNACINHLRTDSMTEYVVIENGGWHFNAIGGKEMKKDLFKHPVYEDNGVWNNREVNMRLEEEDLPEFILNDKIICPKLLL